MVSLPKAEHLADKSLIQITDSVSVFGHTVLYTQWKPLLSLCYLSRLSPNTLLFLAAYKLDMFTI